MARTRRSLRGHTDENDDCEISQPDDSTIDFTDNSIDVPSQSDIRDTSMDIDGSDAAETTDCDISSSTYLGSRNSAR